MIVEGVICHMLKCSIVKGVYCFRQTLAGFERRIFNSFMPGAGACHQFYFWQSSAFMTYFYTNLKQIFLKYFHIYTLDLRKYTQMLLSALTADLQINSFNPISVLFWTLTSVTFKKEVKSKTRVVSLLDVPKSNTIRANLHTSSERMFWLCTWLQFVAQVNYSNSFALHALIGCCRCSRDRMLSTYPSWLPW
jgi:hypothetical protein